LAIAGAKILEKTINKDPFIMLNSKLAMKNAAHQLKIYSEALFSGPVSGCHALY
jgi:hypothetical protein